MFLIIGQREILRIFGLHYTHNDFIEQFFCLFNFVSTVQYKKYKKFRVNFTTTLLGNTTYKIHVSVTSISYKNI